MLLLLLPVPPSLYTTCWMQTDCAVSRSLKRDDLHWCCRNWQHLLFYSYPTSSHHNTTTNAAFASLDKTHLLKFTSLSFIIPWFRVNVRRPRVESGETALAIDASLKISPPAHVLHLTHVSIQYPAAEMSHTPLLLHSHTPPLSQARNYLLCVWMLLSLCESLCQWEQKVVVCVCACVCGGKRMIGKTVEELVWTLNPHISITSAFTMNIWSCTTFPGNLEVFIKLPLKSG